MKRKLLYLLSIALLAACSAPKYTYNFGHYDYQAGKRKVAVTESASVPMTPASELTASVSNNEPVAVTKPVERIAVISADKVIASQTSNAQEEGHTLTKRELKKEVKQYIRSVKKANSVEGVSEAKSIDNDLKLAAIFGAVGIVALIIGGQVFWIIGGVALIIGVIFFVKWLLRQ